MTQETRENIQHQIRTQIAPQIRALVGQPIDIEVGNVIQGQFCMGTPNILPTTTKNQINALLAQIVTVTGIPRIKARVSFGPAVNAAYLGKPNSPKVAVVPDWVWPPPWRPWVLPSAWENFDFEYRVYMVA